MLQSRRSDFTEIQVMGRDDVHETDNIGSHFLGFLHLVSEILCNRGGMEVMCG